MMKPYVQPPEDSLAEVDRLIIETARRGSELIMRHASVAEVDVEVDFMRHLYQRRDLILHELKKSGINEREAYEHIRQKETVMT